MAVVNNFLYPNSWVNADGLFVKFGTDEAVVSRSGDFEDTFGPLQQLDIGFTFSDLGPTFGNDIVLNTTSPIRKGSRLQEVTVISEVSPTGATATLNVGLIQDDFLTQTGTGIGSTAILNAETVAALSAHGNGTELIYTAGSGATAGASLGLTLGFDGFITARANTALFTAGQWIVIVRYYLPSTTE